MSNDRPTPEYAIELLSYLPTRPEYNEWLDCISAIGNTFDIQTAEYIISTRFADLTKDETLYKLKHRKTNINFGTLYYYAEKYGFKFADRKTKEVSANSTPYVPTRKSKVQPEPAKIVRFDDPPDLKFTYPVTEYLPEFLKEIIDFETKTNNRTVQSVRAELLSQDPKWLKTDRLFRLAINRQILDKNKNPQTKEPYTYFDRQTQTTKQSHWQLNSLFENYEVRLEHLIEAIGLGYALCPTQLQNGNNGKPYKIKNNWIGADLFFIDIDNKDPQTKNRKTNDYMTIDDCLALTETQQAMILYESPSYTPDWHRFRLVFPLPRYITDPQLFVQVVKKYVQIYQADDCSSEVNAFYGNSNAKIYNLTNGDIIKYRDGVKQ